MTAVGVDGGSNRPGTDTDADGEVMLDIEVVGAVATGAEIVVYFAPNTDQGFIDAVSHAVHDTTHKPSVVSISWGGPRTRGPPRHARQMEQVLTDAGGLGVTVAAAAGDNGSTDSVTDGQQHVDFPASAPHALACGGTTLTPRAPRSPPRPCGTRPPTGRRAAASRHFALPSYQSAAKVPTTSTPALPAAGFPTSAPTPIPPTGYAVRVDGQISGRRHERRRPPVGGADRAAQPVARRAARFRQAAAVPAARLGGLPGHHLGQQRLLQRRPGMGRLHRLGSPDGAALASQLAGGASG